jgi:hypothetical protein
MRSRYTCTTRRFPVDILLGHPPAQIDIHQVQFAPLAPLLELGKHLLDQVIALGMYVVEGAADEDVDLFPLDGHDR